MAGYLGFNTVFQSLPKDPKLVPGKGHTWGIVRTSNVG